MKGRAFGWVLAAVGASLLGCGGWFRSETDGSITAEIEGIEGTRLEAPPDAIPTLSFDPGSGSGGGEGTGPIDSGDGVQVLYASPFGVDRKALQAAVVFDRPMVAMSDLDTMTGSVPLSCTPDVGRARWAGTSTAVFLPDGGAFPPGNTFECAVPAGTKALDGVTLEKEVRWSFETPRPRLVRSVFPPDDQRYDPKQPIVLLFDQPVDPAEVGGHLEIRGGGRAVPVKVTASKESSDPSSPSGLRHSDTRLEVTAELDKDSEYTLVLTEGIVGKGGPLPSTSDQRIRFRTYPPLRIEEHEPTGQVVPTEWLRLELSTPVTEEQVARHLTIEPKPEGWEPADGTWPSRWWSYGVPLQPNTTYTVRIAADLTDEYGQKLGQPFEWSFETGDYEPWLTTPHGLALYAANNPKELPFKQLNASRIDATAAPFDPARFTSPREWFSATRARLEDPAAVTRFDVALEAPKNRTEIDLVDLGPLLGPSGFGWVATRFSAPNLVDWDGNPVLHDGLLVVTDLGATLKVAPGATEVWVTSLSSGAPVEGVEVELFTGASSAGKARTDKNGLVRIDGAPRVSWDWENPVWARLKKGDDTSLVLQDWDDGLMPWQFGVSTGESSSPRQVLSHGFADRGIYRLGDPVYARASFRMATKNGLEPLRAEVHWTLNDPDGNEAASGDGSLDDRGGFSLQTAVPSTGMLGDWTVHVLAAGEGWQQAQRIPVPARAYRAPAFRVEVVAPPVAVAGEEVRATADARYLFGAPMKSGQVHWRSWTEDTSFEPEGFEGWSFGPLTHWWDQEREPEAQVSGDQVLALEGGTSTFTQKIEKGYRDQPVKLFLEAEVTDVDRQVVANRATALVHPAAFYAGIKSTVSLPKVGDEVPLQIVAVDPIGAPRAEALEVKVVRREWNSVREKGMDGRWRWVNTPVDEVVGTWPVKTTTDPKSPAEASFSPTKAGYHVAIVTGKDAQGNEVVGETGIYVLGSGYVGWGRTDDNRLELVPDQKAYEVGDTARILVKAPAEGMQALVTVEREGVLSRQVVKLASNASTVEVPLTAAHRPNVFVSVVAVQGAGPQDGPDKGAPTVHYGLVDLKVKTDAEHLEVAIAPSATEYRPRDTVEVDVTVRRAGKPIAGAGVTLYAVDEAVLSLTDYQTPDAHAAFYAPRGLSVRTADARIAALDRASFLTKGAGRGGGGGEEGASGPEIRSKFVTTITWQPDLRTGPDGSVRASFTLPDNLTTFRIMAVADADVSAFGSGEAEIEVNRPLMVRPALPRLLRAGDQAYAGVVVHNATGSDRWVKVEAKIDGPIELKGSPANVQVPAGGSLEVPFSLKALEPGAAKFTFTATSGRDRDALEWPLEVEREVLLETVATASRFEGARTERIARPDGASPTLGGLEIDLATTALVGVGSGLEYLRAYPHECLEQRTSRGLAGLMALRVKDRAPVPIDAQVLKDDVTAILADLHRYRTGAGGLGYWDGDRDPSTLATAYAVELMGRAKEDGFPVDAGLFDDSVDYLRAVLAGHRRADWHRWSPEAQLVAKSYVALALARAGVGDAGLESEIYRQRKQLSVFGVASLLEAIARTTGADKRTDELAKLIASRSFVEAASASVKENDTDRWDRLWGSDDLSTAAALEALVTLEGDDVLAPRYALHLASSKVGDRWANTRATAGVLSALAAYADKYEAASGGAVEATVALAGKELLKQSLKVPGTASVDLPMGEVDNGDLVFGSAGGPLYYETRLTYAPKDPPPRDEGFTLTRTLELVDGGADGVVTAGAQVRVTLTVVTPVVRHDVALVDRIPAGFEPVDSSLATASQKPSEQEENLGYWDADDGELLEESWDDLPEYGGSEVFDHHEIDDAEVRLYARNMPPGIHTWRYLVRATTPGRYTHPPATVEEMYEPENFGRTRGGPIAIGAAPKPVATSE